MIKRDWLIGGILITLVIVISIATIAMMLVPYDEPTSEFDPREHPASSVYWDEDGNPIRGLMMTDETFKFITFGLDSGLKAELRNQIDEYEDKYTRNYVLYDGVETDYIIENGIVIGSQPHTT